MEHTLQLPLGPLPPGRLPVFLDTSFLVALFDDHDARAEAAREFYDEHVLEVAIDLCTSSVVACETLEHLSRAAHNAGTDHSVVHMCADLLYTSRQIKIIDPAYSDIVRARELLDKYVSARIGWIDCLSLAMMDEREVRAVCTFDTHFMRHRYSKGREERSVLVLPAYKSLLVRA